MAGLTAQLAETRLLQYMDAEAKVLKGQSVTIDGESLTRANLDSIREGIEYWNQKSKDLTNAESGVGRSITVRPRW